jgi:hypothetical protein
VRHVLFTEPEVVKAGQTVTMFYNPQDTPLNGRDKVRRECFDDHCITACPQAAQVWEVTDFATTRTLLK